MTTVKVKQDEQRVVTVEVLATEIVAISAGIKKLRAGRLTDDALILLIQNAAPTVKSGKYSYVNLTRKSVKAVLDGIEGLEQAYLKPKKPSK